MSEMDVTTWVLVEGRRDVAAVVTLAGRLGIDLAHTRVVDLGGATNVGTVARTLAGTTARVTGMCDAAEERFFAKALDDYEVCNADHEEELIRSLGIEGTERVIEEQGDLALLRTFQNQPFQRDRTRSSTCTGSSARPPDARRSTGGRSSRRSTSSGCPRRSSGYCAARPARSAPYKR